MAKVLVALALLGHAAAFLPTLPLRRTVAIHGFMDDLMDKLDGGDSKGDDWKDEMMAEQKRILSKRKASGGFITEEDEEEFRARRANIGEEEDRLKAIQQSQATDNLDQWKEARDSGAIKTPSSGMKRDADSSRMGSAGLFAERADAKMPYIDRGYVAPQKVNSEGIPIKETKEAAASPFGGFQNPFEKKAASPAPAPAPAPSNPFAAFFDKPKAPEPEPEPEPESAPNPFEAFGKMFEKKD